MGRAEKIKTEERCGIRGQQTLAQSLGDQAQVGVLPEDDEGLRDIHEANPNH